MIITKTNANNFFIKIPHKNKKCAHRSERTKTQTPTVAKPTQIEQYDKRKPTQVEFAFLTNSYWKSLLKKGIIRPLKFVLFYCSI